MSKTKTKVMLQRPGTDEILAELKVRIAACRKSAKDASEADTIHKKVCDRTARELERIVFWAEMP